MEGQQFEFIPCGDQPTVDNTWQYYWKGVAGLVVITFVVFIFIDPKMYVNLLLLCAVLVLLLTSITLSNEFTTKIHIDMAGHKFYKFYITTFGREGVTVLDLNTSKITYKLDISRTGTRWILKVKDLKSSVKFRETKNLSSKTQKNVFTKAQLDQMNAIMVSRI